MIPVRQNILTAAGYIAIKDLQEKKLSCCPITQVKNICYPKSWYVSLAKVDSGYVKNKQQKVWAIKIWLLN